MSWSIMIGGDVGDGGDAAEREAAILSAVVHTVRGLGDEVTYASFTGVTTGAVNVVETANAEPAHDSPSVAPEAKLADRLAGADQAPTGSDQAATTDAPTDVAGAEPAAPAGGTPSDAGAAPTDAAPTV